MPEHTAARLVVAITGGIGSGKSSVSRFWARKFAVPLVDIDLICRELMEKGRAGWQAVRDSLGESFFLPTGLLDRHKLRAAIFQDSAIRCRVDGLIHPLVLLEMRRQCKELAGAPLILAEVPLLFEAGWQHEFQRLVVVFAEKNICLRRLSARDCISAPEALRAINSQSLLLEKALRADHVVDNSGCWLYTRLQVMHLAGILEKQ